MRLAVFYHCLFVLGEPPEVLPRALAVVREQMETCREAGLTEAVEQFHVGVNGGQESEFFARILPEKAQIKYHGLQSRAENLTLIMLEEWLKQPDRDDWAVLYFHAKGATHPPGSSYGEGVSDPWRRTMMHYTVRNWRTCVEHLQRGFESAGCHWLIGQCDGTQNYWPGNFWWATSAFLKTVPSMYHRDRIKVSGIASLESRYEAEVWIGNGRLPRVADMLPGGGYGVP